MRVTFGLELDGGCYPDPLGGRRASIGEVTVGPMGLLGLLETRLGLGGVPAPEPVRVLQYRRRLEAAARGRFFECSLAADPIGTARTLLEWRDTLAAGGWAGEAGKRGRLADLAAVERAADVPPLAGGTAERARAVLRELERPDRSSGIARLTLAESADKLPPPWPAIVRALERGGCALAALKPPPGALGGRLRKLQLALAGRPVEGVEGPGEVVLLTASSDSEAAEAVAVWLEDGADGTVVIAGREDNALDRALIRRSLPSAGAAPHSAWRPALQVLPLAVALRWLPRDPERLLEFLLLPASPLPGGLARRLAAALAAEPGTGGRKWRAAMARLEGDDSQAGARELSERLEAWIGGPGYAPETGIPRAELVRLAEMTAAWAAAAGGQDETLAAAVQQAVAVRELLTLSGEERVPQLLWDSLIEETARRGVRLPGRHGEIGHVAVVAHPGAILGPARRVLWWDFSGGAVERAPWSPWTASERALLAGCGVQLQSPVLEVERLWQATVRAVGAASEMLVLVAPAQRRGEPCGPHPMLARLASALGGELAACTRSCLERSVAGEPAAASGVLEPVPPRRLPARVRVWRLPAATHIPSRKLESYSSLGKLLDHPYQWVLSYAAQLWPGLLQPLPRPRQLLGTLAHRLLQEALLEPELEAAAWSPDAVEAWLGRRAPGVLGEEGLPLLMPERLPDRQRLSAAVARSVMTLARLMREGGWRLAAAVGKRGLPGSELAVQGTFVGGELSGELDLLLVDPDGRHAVLDMKWSRWKLDGEQIPLQLLVYGRLIEQSTGAWPRVAHLFLEQGVLYPADALRPIGTRSTWTETDCAAQWPAVEELWRARREQLDRGLVEVTAVKAGEGEGLELPPEARAPEGAPKFDGGFGALVGWLEQIEPDEEDDE